MIIEKTKIPDVVKENIDISKIILADNIISNIYPLFDDMYNESLNSTKNLESQYKKKKIEVKNSKEKLEGLMLKLTRVKKILKLLNRIEKLIDSGLVYDGSLKHETIILLKIINKLSNDKIDFHLRNTLKTISKRFSQ
jgi:hypothetical protein